MKAVQPLWIRRLILETKVREFFYVRDFLETRTPLLVSSPGLEPHIFPLEVKRPKGPSVFLPTSPEFAMKKLLARGVPKIFQLASAFRDEPASPDHSPEFTLLEFYETNIQLEQLQERIEELFRFLARECSEAKPIVFRGEEIDLDQPWLRLRIPDLFLEHVNIDLRTHLSSESLAHACEMHNIQVQAHEPWDDLYFKLWLNLIEPKLPKNKPCFVTHYPLSQSSLCNPILDEKGFAWANRFEVYVGQFELGNAFDELRDSKKQRRNFEHDQKIRREIYGDAVPTSPIDEEFIAALEKMEPTCGIALGVDRMAMLILGAATIEEVIPLPSFW